MKRMLMLVLAIGMVAAFSATAIAQQPLEYKVTVKAEVLKGSLGDHFVTFTEPVEIPDATLPAGTYLFTMLGSSLVQVSTADRSEQLAMFFTTPVRRLSANDGYEVTLQGAARGTPRRIGAFFIANSETGLEFLYPTATVAADR